MTGPQPHAASLRSLLAARSLKCSFTANAYAGWKSGQPKVVLGREAYDLHFDSIDVKAQKARLIGNQAAVDVSATATQAGLHFMEQTALGNTVITTVFARQASDGFIVVSSRHRDLINSALPSQYHGVCKLWQ